MKNNFEKFYSEDDFLNNLSSYQGGKSIAEIAEKYALKPEEVIKLASNENPFGPSPMAMQAIKNYLNSEPDFNRYSDIFGESLVKKIKQKFPKVGDAEIVVGNGLDNVLECLSRLFIRKDDKVLIISPTFSYYELITNWQQGQPVFFELKEQNNFSLSSNDIEILEKQLKENKYKLLFICNPNNPTSNYFSRDLLLRLVNAAEQNGTFIFVDEAYIEFSGEKSLIDEVKNYKNLLVGRTFSKLYGLAGQRIGWGVLPKYLLNEYRKVQTPFNLSTLGLISALSALDDSEFLQKALKNNSEQKTFLENELKALGFRVFPSNTNFISFCVSPIFAGGEEIFCQKLLEKGIILRLFKFNQSEKKFSLVRCTIGSAEQNQILLDKTRELLK